MIAVTLSDICSQRIQQNGVFTGTGTGFVWQCGNARINDVNDVHIRDAVMLPGENEEIRK